MRRVRKTPFALATFLALLLSGCSDAGGDDGGASATASATMTATGPPPKPPVLVDTLHLLAAPDMALALPDGGSEQRTGTAGDFGPGSGGGEDGPTALWTYQVAGYSNVTSAEVHVWVEILDTLLPFPPNPFNMGQQQCTWMVRLELGADAEPHFGCLVEPPGPVSPGTRELVFDLVGLDAELEANETVTFTFQRAAFSPSPEDSVLVLSGTQERDSRIVLAGLKEPLPEA